MTNDIKLFLLMEKFLITGGKGFIGKHLVKFLSDKDCELLLIIRNTIELKKNKNLQKIKTINMDIRENIPDYYDLKEYVLINLAWEGLPNFNSEEHFKNIEIHMKFISQAVELGVSKIIVTGTCFEYGDVSGQVSAEETPKPMNAYGKAKNILRKKIQKLAKLKNIDLIWLRLFYVYGDGQHSKSLYSSLKQVIDNNEKIFNMSPGDQIRDFISVKEACEQIYNIHYTEKEGIYNVCTGKPVTIVDFVKKLIKEKGKKIDLNLGHYPYSIHEPKNFWGKK